METKCIFAGETVFFGATQKTVLTWLKSNRQSEEAKGISSKIRHPGIRLCLYGISPDVWVKMRWIFSGHQACDGIKQYQCLGSGCLPLGITNRGMRQSGNDSTFRHIYFDFMKHLLKDWYIFATQLRNTYYTFDQIPISRRNFFILLSIFLLNFECLFEIVSCSSLGIIISKICMD